MMKQFFATVTLISKRDLTFRFYSKINFVFFYILIEFRDTKRDDFSCFVSDLSEVVEKNARMYHNAYKNQKKK